MVFYQRLLISTYVLGLILVAQMAFGQELTKDTLSAESISKDRKIRPGDLLKITVYDHEEFPSDVRVEPNGTISYPFMKDINIEGLTIQQVTNILSSRLTQFLSGRAEVIVSFAIEETMDIVILGQVDKPGAHRIPANHTIQGAIWAAVPNNRSDLNNIKLLRTNKETAIIEESVIALQDLILRKGKVRKFPSLQSGDVIFVPTLFGATYVNIIGAVQRAGNYEIFPGANVVDVIFLAGGPKPDASLRGVKLIRRVGVTPVETLVDIESVLKARSSDIPEIKAGDIIFVPAKKFTLSSFFRVLGYLSSVLTLVLLYLTVQLRSEGKR